VAASFRRCGLNAEAATIAAEVVLYADLHGYTTHGSNALAGIYAPRLLDGRIRAEAVPYRVSDTVATASLDADGGLGLVSMTLATDLAMEKARAAGIGLVTVRNSSHFGSAGYYAQRATEAGLIAIVMSNCGEQGIVPPLGGTTRMVGTNPLAAGVPAPGGPPFLLDMSTTTVATGKIRAAQREGASVPAGWLADQDGHPVSDPDAFFDGTANMTWLGGTATTGAAKGYGLAILIDLLCGPLAGAAYGPQSILLTDPTERPDSDIGHLVIAVDPAVLGSPGTFAGAARNLLDTVSACPPAVPDTSVTYPGAPEWWYATDCERSGVTLPDPVFQQLTALAERLDLQLPAILDRQGVSC
jgi:LDH2 family malate/lactate/ureidoglycolate dehydrogenase